MSGFRTLVAILLLALVGTVVAVAQWIGAGAAIAVGGVLSLLLSWAAFRRIDARIRAVSDALSAVAEGRPAARLAWQNPLELARLATSVNELGEQMQRRLAEASNEHARMRAVLDGMVEGVLVLDARGRTLLANRRFRELFSAWAEVQGRTALEVMRRSDVDDALARAAHGAEPVFMEIQLGDDRCVEMHAVRFPGEGPALGTVAVFHDVSEIRSLEGMRRDFVANVSHELRTPLTAIRGFAETMLAGDGGAEQREQHLGVILRHSERLSALIEDLLELSSIEGKRTPLEIAPVDGIAVIRSVLRDLKPRFDERKIRQTLEATISHPMLVDRRALEQILLNLLDNALKYSEAGAEVCVRVQDEQERVRIEVVDTGIGIPESDLARIFERFYRVDKARSRDLGGTGLGLAIVKHLVQAMGGEVFAESRQGSGTTLSVLLPAG